MVANEQFFQRPQPAAVLKHAVLREYLTVFTAMVGSIAKGPVWLLDGYAGPGYYEAEVDDDPIPGSPIVALEVAQKWGHQRDVRCVFIEKNPKHAVTLASNVRPFVDSGLIAEVLQGQVQDKFADAWNFVNGGPVLTFLDPFGVGMDRSIMTDSLLDRKRSEPSEVLLNINVEAVSRLGGWLELVDGIVRPKADIHSAAGVERVDRFLGGEEWRTEFFHARADGNAAEAAETVVRAYCARVEAETGFKSISIPVRRRPTHPVLFLLTLFFKSPAAGYKFADAAARATRKWRDVYRQVELEDRLTTVATQDALFDVEEMTKVDAARSAEDQEKELAGLFIDLVAANIRSALVTRCALNLGEDIKLILGSTLSLAGEPSIRKAWDRLAKEGLVEARDKSEKALWRAQIRKR